MSLRLPFKTSPKRFLKKDAPKSTKCQPVADQKALQPHKRKPTGKNACLPGKPSEQSAKKKRGGYLFRVKPEQKSERQQLRGNPMVSSQKRATCWGTALPSVGRKKKRLTHHPCAPGDALSAGGAGGHRGAKLRGDLGGRGPRISIKAPLGCVQFRGTIWLLSLRQGKKKKETMQPSEG